MSTRALPDPNAEPTITADRAAAILDVSTTTILESVKSGSIPSLPMEGVRAVRIPTRRFLEKFFPDEVDAAPAVAPSVSAEQVAIVVVRRFVELMFPEILATEFDDAQNRPARDQGKQVGVHPNLTTSGGSTRSGLTAVRDSPDAA